MNVQPKVKLKLDWSEMLAISRRFGPYARPYARYFVLGILATFILNAAGVVQPYILKKLTDDVLSHPGGDFRVLNLSCLALVGTAVVRGCFLYVQAYMMAYGNNSTVRQIREDVYRHLQRLPMAWFDSARLGDIIVRLTEDVRTVTEMLTSSLILLMNDTIVAVSALTYMCVKNLTMTLLAFLLSPVTAVIISRLDKSIEQAVVSGQEKLADLTSQLQETLSGIRVVKAFNREDFEARRYQEVSTESYNLTMRVVRASLAQNPAVEIVSTLSLIIVIGYGAYAVSHKIMTLGEFMAFWGYLLLASTPVSRITNTLSNMRRSLLAARRIFELRDLEAEVHDAPDAVVLPPIAQSVTLEHLTFGYTPENPVLQDLHVHLPFGSVVAIVGPNGAGKSTFLSLLARFYDPQEGRILIDGHDLRTVKLASLRRQIGFVLQDNVLFSGTLRDNIAYARPEASDAEVEAAARAGHCHDFICQLPEGYQTQVIEGGRGLSGGQRQRIAIARAVLADPKLLFLDEATASLDLESEKQVSLALTELMHGRSTFVIAHRLSTVRRADVILVLEGGRLVQQGTHDELLKVEGTYQRLHNSFYALTPIQAGAPAAS